MIKLCAPSMDLLSSYLEAMEEMRLNGDVVWESLVPGVGESSEAFVSRILLEPYEPLPGLVPATTYWAVSEDVVVGRISLRHFLNESLREYGGHIGYEVRPSARRKGVASTMLRELLKMPKCREIEKLLLTCAPDNLGSIKVIEKNGGVFEKTIFVARINRETSHYWIDLTAI